MDLKSEYKKTGDVDWIPRDSFPSERVFCMVGQDRMDYGVALGLSRTFAGHGSSGLVRIENATLKGMKGDGSLSAPCAKAFAYQGPTPGVLGIVNSEEAYQNLIRFLFGDVRVDIWVDIEAFRLPPEAAQAAKDSQDISALLPV